MKKLIRKLRELLSEPLARPALAGFFLLLTQTAQAAGGGGHGAPSHINFWQWDAHSPPVGWYAVNLLLIAVLFVKFVKPALAGALKARHEKVQSSIDQAERDFQKANSLYEEYKAKLAKVDAEVQDLITESKRAGEDDKDQLVKDAKGYSEGLERDTESIMTYEALQAKRRLQREVVVNAAHHAEKIIVGGLTSEDHAALFERALGEIESGDIPPRGRVTQAAEGRAERAA